MQNLLELWFVQTFIAPINQILKIIFFEFVDSLAKIFLILYPPFENSTTCIAICVTYGSGGKGTNDT